MQDINTWQNNLKNSSSTKIEIKREIIEAKDNSKGASA